MVEKISLIREPLVHFLMAGALIFAGYALWQPEGGSGAADQIEVNRATLVQYMQSRAQTTEPGSFEARHDALSAADRQSLIDDYVREEAFYREAKALGLDEGDGFIRQRLIQQMGALLETGEVAEPTTAELQAYLARHQDLYAIAPVWTFTHVFIDPAVRGQDQALREAGRLLIQLNRDRVGDAQALQLGDPYPFLCRYDEDGTNLIASHFGASFMHALESQPVGDDLWLGPLRSDQGLHLVRIASKRPARPATLEETRELLIQDLRRDRAEAARKGAVAALVRKYEVRVKKE